MSGKQESSLKKGIVLIFVANVINLLIGILNGFVLPKFIAIETYADIKTYQLYTSYIGVLSLGYVDGLYLRYGGKHIAEVKDEEINISRTNLLIFQGILSALLVTVSLWRQDVVFALAALTIVPINIVAAYKNILQATGEFQFYSRIMNFTSLCLCCGTMMLVFAFHSDNAIHYVGVMSLVSFLVWILVEWKIRCLYAVRFRVCLSIVDFQENIKSGIVLMLGNFSSILITSIDRWFVKALLTTRDFACYSFVVSAENLVAVFINPIVTTMYNYICITKDYVSIRRIKRMCMIFSLFLISSAFPIKMFLELFLHEYIECQYILFILFATEIFFLLIKGIYVNIYKANKRQSLYLGQLLFVIVLGCVLNVSLYLLFGTMESIAVATFLDVLCWYIMCEFSQKEIQAKFSEVMILFVALLSFFVCGIFLPTIIGFVVYVLVVMILSYSFMRFELGYIAKIVLNGIKKKVAR